MCGIFAVFNNRTIENDKLKKNFIKAKGRGPESTNYINNELNKHTIGFLRLAINGLDKKSDQPLFLNDVVLICNGEIYNYKKLYENIKVYPETNSDCEIIIHLYKKYGIEQTLQMIDGVFAFVLIDNNKAYVARDPYGVRPLFKQTYSKGCFFPEESLIFTSELKQLMHDYDATSKVSQFEPGTYCELQKQNQLEWKIKYHKRYHTFGFLQQVKYTDKETSLNYYRKLIRDNLTQAVRKRVQTTDRPIACLLSGGLDSSLITSLVSSISDKQIETYSIGLKDSVDLKYARMVADHLKTKHTEIVVSEETFFDAIPEVIKTIESYDTTTVRASVGNYLVAKYISENSEAKVIFNGDGSDELTGGYMYFHCAPDSYEFDAECRRLLNNIHFFDVLRSDRCISAHGLEARTPFLDRGFVELYLSIPCEMRNHNIDNKCEKYLLRSSFMNQNLLPEEVLWRTKEAFSDGVSGMKKSWTDIISEKIQKNGVAKIKKNYEWNPPKTDEEHYYRNEFNIHYGMCEKIIPYFWMPKYVNARDASARKLDIYKEKIES